MEDEQARYPVLKHEIFTWNIVNFILCLATKTYDTESPIFSFADSTWCLKLFVRCKGKKCFFRMSLCRCAAKDCSADVINTRFYIELASPSFNLIWRMPDKGRTFRREDSYEIDFVLEREKLLKHLEDFYNDTLVVVCAMISVKELYESDDFSNDGGKGILSRELKKLLTCTLAPENAYLLTYDGKTCPVHKEVLSARSPVFKQIFMSGNNYISTDYCEAAVQGMLRFVYSGRFRDIAENGQLPSPWVYWCAQKYDIRELERTLVPTRICASTIIECKTENICRVFPQFLAQLQRGANSAEAIRKMMAEEISFDGGNVKGSLSCTLYPTKGEFLFEMQLRYTTDVPSERKAVGVSVIFNVGKVRHRTISSFDKRGTSSSSFTLRAEDLFRTETLLLSSGILELQCKIKFGLPNKIHISEVDCRNFTETIADERCVSGLAREMGNLFNSQLFVDCFLTVPIKGEVCQFGVHKSILSARSPVFRKLLKEGNDCILLDLSVCAAKALVSYIYTGTLDNIDTIGSLYEAAETYKIYGLRDQCIKLIKFGGLDHKNVFKKFQLASATEDSVLKQSCEVFILKNMDILLGTMKWRYFKERSPDLAGEVLSSIIQTFSAF